MTSPICDLLGISVPVLQGGMAWISDWSLASAVSNAGGLGTVAAGNAPADYVRDQIQKTREHTNKPFAVNVMLMSPFAEEIAELLIAERVPVVVTGAGNPERFMRRWLDAGIKVVPVVPSTGVARRVEKLGATAVIAEGGESGGHIGELTTMALVPQVCDAVSIPVIAAGGIADGRGFAAALMLGAVGVQVGTRFLVANECTVHPNYKQRILAAKDIDTVSTGRRLGHPVRSLKNAFSRGFAALEYEPNTTLEQLEEYGVGALRLAAVEGDRERGCFMSGQVAGLVKREQSAAEIIADLISGAEAALKGASSWVK
ncbi:MAG: enoyl-[acyl-carrier-protein] reductase FabK [Oscillospiraceae bacterium]|jgi:enoyl-[acyl-carrier protein] reductase II|nr:enoyl-[acyl-carrier-protein] reductase FabK [Oscillospiraceae bacterium]